MRIRAAVVDSADAPFSFRDVELDAPRPNEILVRVVATGVCQTDAHIRAQDYETALPIILGHEGAGVVDRVGSEVTTVQVGDHVVMSYPSCGTCRYCLTGHAAYCVHGFELSFLGERLDGSNAYGDVHGHFFGQSSFATYSLANERNVVKVSKDAPLELLGPLGCGMQTGAGTVFHSLNVQAGSSVAVFGAGAVGLASIMAAKVVGASRIIAVDVFDDRLALAKELGATDVVNGKSTDVKAAIMDVTGGGADYLVELTAQPEMLALGLECTAMMGHIAQVGGPPAGVKAKIDMNLLLNGRNMHGVIQGDSVPQLLIPELVAMHQHGNFPFDRLTKTYDFDDIEQAFTDTRTGVTIKPILRVSSL